MKRLTFLPLALCLLFPSSALALSARTIFAEQAQGTNGTIVTLEVSPGYGLNINLIPTGEVVKKAWIDDPSRIALSFDGNLCQWKSEQQQSCSNEGATVVHLRQIQPIQFQNLPRSRSGGTLLTLIAEGASGRKVYQFRVVPASGEPKYTALIVKPDSERPRPVLDRMPTIITSAPQHPQSAAPNRQLGSNTNTTVARVQPSLASTNPSLSRQEQASPKKPSQPPATTSPNQIATSKQAALAPTPKQPATLATSTDSAPAQQQVTNSHLNPSSNVSKSSTPAPAVSRNVSTHPRNLAEDTGTPTTTPQASARSTTTTEQPNLSLTSIETANALVRGLVVARQKGQINHQTTMWRQVQSAVAWLRRGATKQEAALKAGVPLKTINQLLAWGQVSPLSSLSSPKKGTQARTN
ncbi:hypothetical protein [Chroococcidiopsis sp. CCMEE 29]|uniref:hypothetical protein n=1 Tax=Chroococcidiopsis sp. CCMEE 29 TaxID=155894 RepID=UPI00202056BE|nr:hypothetical protein [Chroococcidiopsis sp. CCMEE 29]